MINTTYNKQTFPCSEEPVPLVIHKKILQMLPPGDVPVACRVCKHWCAVATDENFWNSYDIKTLIPGFKTIDEAVWQRRVPRDILKGLTFAQGMRPCLSRRQFQEIRQCGLPTTKLTLLEVPAGFSYKVLKAVNFDDTLGPRVNLWISLSPANVDWEDDVPDGFINQTTKQPQTMVITDEILPGSEQEPREEKAALAKTRDLKVLDVATLHTLTHKEAPHVQGTFGSKSIYPTKTMCCDLMDKTTHATIGTSGGQNVSMQVAPAGTSPCGVGAKWVLKYIELKYN